MLDHNGLIPYRDDMLDERDLVLRLNEAMEQRHIAAGLTILNEVDQSWSSLDYAHADFARVTLCIAQWVDVGYRNYRLISELLERCPSRLRATMPFRDYLLLRLAEAFAAMAAEDAEVAIELLDFVVKSEDELLDPGLAALAHFWKARSHRKKGEYEAASSHILEARKRTEAMASDNWTAVIKVQQAWICFQKGDGIAALVLLKEAEKQLKTTDDAIALGNIESARGRIVRRTGNYTAALHHYSNAIEIYRTRDAHHRNLARALVNSAYVKRLMALHLRKRIDARSSQPAEQFSKRPRPAANYHSRYIQLCEEALEQLYKAMDIYERHGHQGGIGAVLVNAAHLHLDMGDMERAKTEGLKAYSLGQGKQDHILMARARILEASVENLRVDEQLGEDEDSAMYGNLARLYAEEAIELAKQTQNRRLLAAAYIARGTTAATEIFQEWDEARSCATRAAALLKSDDRDHLWEELIALKARILRFSGIDETLRAWSEGMLGEKTFQEVTEEFAEMVIPKVWAREGKNISRVAEKLCISPKKIRRILRNTGLLN